MPEATPSPRQSQITSRHRLVALPGGHDRARRHNLPAEVSSFIGREAELAEVMRLLSSNRLVTLVGPGGAGKTRLALAAAAELVEVFDDGPWVVELGSLSNPSLVPQALASTLGVRERPGRAPSTTLCEILQNKSVLLVLDNCEHLIAACTSLTETLLHACTELRIMATSREALGLTGEVAWPVPPLTLPDRGRQLKPDEIGGYESVRLFVERVVAIKPSFALTAANAASVVQVAEQLDGLPLALELAAARAKHLSVQEISARLDDSLGILDIGERTALARHRTLYATIDWSYDLLAAEERLLFRRLSVFVGGFTLTAAESVCAGDGLEPGQVLRVLSQLVDKSLVAHREWAGQTRYQTLETVRQYASQQLSASIEVERLERRHAEFCLSLAEEAEREQIGPDQPSWLRRLEVEHDNLRAALTWSTEEVGDAELGARLASAVWPFWFARGYLSEGIHWLTSTADRISALTRPKAMALNGAAMLAAFHEDYDAAVAYAQQSLTIYRSLDDADGTASSMVALGTAALVGQRSDVDVPALLEEARASWPVLTDRRIVGHTLDLAGAIALTGGDAERTIQLWQESLDLSDEIGNTYGQAMSRTNLGMLAVRMADARAEALLRGALGLGLDLDYKLIIQYCFIGLGALAAARGQVVRAARLWGTAEAMSEAFGTHLTRAGRAMIDYEAQVAAARGRLDESTWAAAWAEGRAMAPEEVARRLDDDEAPPLPTPSPPGGLSAREIDVLRLVADGLTNAEAARKLFLSTRTVDWHLSSIYHKLGFHTRTEATRFAVAHGLV